MNEQKSKRITFDISLNWLTDNRGILTSNDVKDTIRVALPPAFGGEPEQWSPEHLFLGSISSCFMTTYLVFAKKFGFEISHLECQTVGNLEMVDGKYVFSSVHLYPKIYIADKSFREKAIKTMEKTEKYCIISNSVKADIIYHGEVVDEKHLRFDKALHSGTVQTN
ncbi:MAG: OsmC family protein [Bacteroidetes bacterium]|nr:OsmC family protein [Bacteroidota bacterium]